MYVEVNRKWRNSHKGKIPFEFSLLLYLPPRGNIKFKQVQVKTVQESQASWKLADTPGLSSLLKAADSLGKEVSGGINPLTPTPGWGMCTSCRATRPSLDFLWGRENHRGPGTQAQGYTAVGHRIWEMPPPGWKTLSHLDLPSA